MHADDKSGVRFRPDVEGLRAVAILFVVFDHLGVPGFRAGFVGVDVFFVISGFLITALLAAEYRRSLSGTGSPSAGSVSIGGFYARRARRILPASMLVIAVTLVTAKFVYNDVRFAEVQASALWSTLFSENFQLMHQATDYFARGTLESPLQNYWSLAVEEQFYFVWPALFLVATALPARLFGRAREGWKARALVAVALGALGSLVWSAAATADNPAPAYFSPFTRAWELGLGALVALVVMMGWVPGRRLSVAAGVAGLALIGLSLLVVSPGSGYPGTVALLPTAGAALLILAGVSAGSESPSVTLLSAGPMRFFGRISYSLYLWHWPIIVFALTLLPRSDLSGAPRGILLFGIAVIAAWASWRFVEQPFRFRGKEDPAVKAQKAARFFSAQTAMASFGVVVLLPIALMARPLPPAPTLTLTGGSSELSESQWMDAVRAAAEAKTITPQTRALMINPSGIRPSSDCSVATSAASVEACIGIAHGKEVALPWGSQGRHLVALYGNSFASQFRADLLEVLPRGTEVATLTTTLCDPGGAPYGFKINNLGQNCDAFSLFAREEVRTLKPDLIILGHNAASRPRDLVRLVRDLRTSGAKVLWLGPTPFAPAAESCLKDDNSIEQCNGPKNNSEFEHNRAYGRAAAAAGAAYLDLATLFCVKEVCPAVIGGAPVRTDLWAHLSTPALRGIRAPLRDAIASALASGN